MPLVKLIASALTLGTGGSGGREGPIAQIGAGFGSFQYLKQLPFRYLKIDGDFIRALPSSHKDQLVV